MSNQINDSVLDAVTSRRGFKPFAIGFLGGSEPAAGNSTSACVLGDDGTLFGRFWLDINIEFLGRPYGGI